MAHLEKFEFSRSRGVVWVCDVAGSSSRLNSDNGVEDTEAFLPRLYWIAALIVDSAGGKFIKWTGDGFLAWFETPLHRDLENVVHRCLNAAWHLSVMVNVTQLGTSTKRPFRIRHGLTYEHDALVTRIGHEGGFESLDLIGRAVVLAFRLSGLKAEFPGIAADKEIAGASRGSAVGQFRRRVLTGEEKLKFFKGEKWGTDALYLSGASKPRALSRNAVLKAAQLAIRDTEGAIPDDDARLAFSKSLLNGMLAGPKWSQNVAADYTRYLNEGLLRNLKALSSLLEGTPSTT